MQVSASSRLAGLFTLIVLMSVSVRSASAQENNSPLDEEGRLVQFSRDIAPILRERCLECHEGDEGQGGFAVDDPAILMDYLVPEAAMDSTLFIDYLVAEDPDMLMPPESEGGPLPPHELALIKTWIDEGAIWPEGTSLGADSESDEVPAAEKTEREMTTGERIWAFQGYFHPATVHFPIALLTIGALFVVIGVIVPRLGTQIPLACLILGSMAAVVASAMGWSFASERGFPSYEAGWGAEVNAHRWSGIIVAGVGVVLCFIAIAGQRKASKPLNAIWKLGLLAMAGMVGLVGHQGGELSYPGLYDKAFKIIEPLTGAVAAPEAETPVSDSVGDDVDSVVSENGTADEGDTTATDDSTVGDAESSDAGSSDSTDDASDSTSEDATEGGTTTEGAGTTSEESTESSDGTTESTDGSTENADPTVETSASTPGTNSETSEGTESSGNDG